MGRNPSSGLRWGLPPAPPLTREKHTTPGGRGSFPEGAGGAVLAYGKPSHFFRFGVDCHHYGSGASGSRIPAANVDPSILLAAGEKFPISWRTAGGGKRGQRTRMSRPAS